MSIHTWFYSPLNIQPTLKDCKKELRNVVKSELYFWKDIYNKTATPEEYGLKDLYKSKWYTEHVSKKSIKELNKILSLSNKSKIIEQWILWCKPNYIYYKGLVYKEVKRYNDLFRVNNFIEYTLHSYNEFMVFYCVHDCSSIYEDIFERMQGFFKEHPKGIIKLS